MKAAVLHKIREMRLEEWEKPQLAPHQVMVRLRAVGVCGSDVHYYLHGRIGDMVVQGPQILGHEPAGEVVEIGPEARAAHLRPGMAVAIEPGVPCGKCEYCFTGRYNLCPRIVFLGTPPVQGAYREYMAYDPQFLHPLPENMGFAEGSLVETLAVGMYAVELAGLLPGDDVAVLGSGPVGLVTQKAARLAGAGRIFVSEPIAFRREFAAAGAHVIPIDPDKENVTEVIREQTKGRGVDVVFEAAGAQASISQTVELSRCGGRVVLIGIPAEDEISFDPHLVRRKELHLLGLRRFKHNFRRCIRAIASGRLSVKEMITHTFPLEEIEQPFKLVEKYADGVIKAVIEL